MRVTETGTIIATIPLPTYRFTVNPRPDHPDPIAVFEKMLDELVKAGYVKHWTKGGSGEVPTG